MPRRRNSVLAGGVTALALLGGVALAQQQSTPESLLPPGFGDPAQKSAPPPPERAPHAPGEVPTIGLSSPPPPPADALPEEALIDNESAAAPETSPDEESLASYDLPVASRRSPDGVGPFGTGAPGLGAGAFGHADGRFLSMLMRGLDAPIASRWTSILLRRALLTGSDTPRGVSGADWTAERAWLLLRMGEADAARMLIAGVDIDRYTPKLLSVATQVALATADPAALCPLTGIAEGMSEEPAWPLARAMCASLSGEAGSAAAMIDAARRRHMARGIDLLLAEKVVGAGSNGRRAINVEWTGVDQLTSWRFGLATATGVAVPDALYATVGRHVQAWRARAGVLAPESRIASARAAAAMGVFSSAALVDLYGMVADRADASTLVDSDAGRLRLAYAGDDVRARVRALRALWTAPGEDGPDRYAALILTAHAAARLAPTADLSGDAGSLMGAMFAAGLDLSAERWGSVVAGARGRQGDRAWSILAVGAPAFEGGAAARAAQVIDDAGSVNHARAALLVAALAGLGRVSATEATSLAASAGTDLAVENRWTRTIDQAARSGQAGTVALLAAVGMQTGDWRGVPPVHLFHMLMAMERVGLDGEARMIAAEAMTRA